MENTTQNKSEWIRLWENHADTFNLLEWTPNPETSKEVSEAIKNLKLLIRKVADEKERAGGLK